MSRTCAECAWCEIHTTGYSEMTTTGSSYQCKLQHPLNATEEYGDWEGDSEEQVKQAETCPDFFAGAAQYFPIIDNWEEQEKERAQSMWDWTSGNISLGIDKHPSWEKYIAACVAKRMEK